MEKEENTFNDFLSPLESSTVGNLNAAQLDAVSKEQIKLVQPQLTTYVPMLIKVLEQLSMFKVVLNLIESYLNNQGIARFYKIFQINIPQTMNEINMVDIRIKNIYQIVKMFENLHRQLQ